MKKILLTLLAVFMFATAGTANVLADEAPEKPYDIYVSFGDSITRGLGSEGATVAHDDAEASDSTIRVVKGAYNTIVGTDYDIIDKEVKQKLYANPANGYYPVAAYGLTTKGTLALISGEDGDTGFGSIDPFEIYGKGKKEDIAKAIKAAKSPLITVNVGLMDVALYSSADEAFQGEMADIIKAADGDTEKALLSIIPAYEKAMFKAYLQWAKDYDELVGKLTKLNKAETIVLVGFFNPLRGVNYEISLGENKGSIYLPIGATLDPIVALMNETSRFLAKKYTFVDSLIKKDTKVVYADVYNGEGYAIETEKTLNDLDVTNIQYAIHGTAKTYEYIARQIENALSAEETTEPSYDIVVDLVSNTTPTDANKGLETKVVANDIAYSAMLDGKKVADEKLVVKGTILTVDGDEKEDHKLLQVIETTYGTKDSGEVAYTTVDFKKEFLTSAKLDKTAFDDAQEAGEIVKLDEKGNVVLKYSKNKLVLQTYQDGDTWVHATDFVPDVKTIDFITEYLTEDEKFDKEAFDADQKAGNIVKLKVDETTGDYVADYEINKRGSIVIKHHETAPTDEMWVSATPRKGLWGKIIAVTPVIEADPVDFTTEYVIEPHFDAKAFNAAVAAGEVVELDDEYKVVDRVNKTTRTITPTEYKDGDSAPTTKWVKAEATPDVNGGILGVKPITAAINKTDTEEVIKVAVRTYVLMWRGDHYEAYAIDSTNDRDARIEKILSPITDPIVHWYTDWYNNLEFTPALEEFKDSVDTYNDAKEAIDDAKKAIETAKAALETAKTDEAFYLEAYKTAKKAYKWWSAKTAEALKKATENLEAAKAATTAAEDALKQTYVDAIDAVKAVIPTIDDAAKKGVEFAKEYSTWAYNFVTHIPDLFQ